MFDGSEYSDILVRCLALFYVMLTRSLANTNGSRLRVIHDCMQRTTSRRIQIRIKFGWDRICSSCFTLKLEFQHSSFISGTKLLRELSGYRSEHSLKIHQRDDYPKKSILRRSEPKSD